ncbi:MAG: lactonase family protein [Synergistaceae bacterium]|jgi:6-phosphogluconolactonase|nr:lactonase family protein [Synergistaceae bacterium]
MREEVFVYVGTYTQPVLFGTGNVLVGKGEGIYCYKMDSETGELTYLFVTENVPNPSYLTLSSCGSFLYCVNELKEYEGLASGAASAFAVEEGGQLRFLNSRATGGTDPCYISVNTKNTHVAVSNFMSGSVCVFPVEKDGSLGERVFFAQHEGKSLHPLRQQGPHAHSAVFDREEKYAFVPDLGIDKIVVYETDFSGAGLKKGPPPVSVTAGAGPRHCVFHPSGRYCYVINELELSVSAFEYDGKGFLIHRQTVSLVPDGVDRSGSIGADIGILPNGKYLYASVRGLDTLSILEITSEGFLSLRENVSSRGKTPRSFAITAEGSYLLVANQDTNNLVVFRIDSQWGSLDEVFETHIPTPVCVRPFLRR